VVLSSILIYVRIRTAHYVALENILNLESIIMSPSSIHKMTKAYQGRAIHADVPSSPVLIPLLLLSIVSYAFISYVSVMKMTRSAGFLSTENAASSLLRVTLLYRSGLVADFSRD
jgi:hypothetical protein